MPWKEDISKQFWARRKEELLNNMVKLGVISALSVTIGQ